MDDVKKENSKQFVLDGIILRMKRYLAENEYKIQMDEFKGYRHDQRFSLSDESNQFVRDFSKRNNLLIAEGIELILYLYCDQAFSIKEMKQNGLYNWNIKV